MIPSISFAKTLRVVVLDSGFDFKKSNKVSLCEDGHKTFTNRPRPHDNDGHGTNVAGLIDKYAKDSKFCMIIVDGLATGSDYYEALKYANSLNPDIINISGGGYGKVKGEAQTVNKILKKGIVMVVAAGNNGVDLNKKCSYFPACLDKRIVVVGNSSYYSNKGRVVDIKTSGNKKRALGITLTGTSQSTAITTGRIIRAMQRKK